MIEFKEILRCSYNSKLIAFFLLFFFYILYVTMIQVLRLPFTFLCKVNCIFNIHLLHLNYINIIVTMKMYL